MDQVRSASPAVPAVALMSLVRLSVWHLIFLLTAVKLLVAALTPLAFDEALYWRYSTHLAPSYIDHPFLNPLLIRLGTTLFGQTPLGVRFASVMLSLPASWAIWATARALYGNDVARTAAWFYNLTLVGAVGSLVATSDQVVVTITCLLMAVLAQIWRTGRGEWWLAFGVIIGLGLCAKFSMLFCACGLLVWLAQVPSQRRWLLTPWPWVAGLLALIVFAPVLLWNATHGWAEFIYQGGRLTVFHWTLRYLGELLGDLILLGGPFVFILGCAGFIITGVTDDERRSCAFLLSFIAPMLVFFAWYATHKRVQGNWVEPVIPAVAMAAAYAAHRIVRYKGWAAVAVRWSAQLAGPMGLLLIGGIYIEAVTGIVPLGPHDPRMRVLAVGWTEVASELLDARQELGAGAVITTDYPLDSWLRFYLPSSIPVEQIDDRMRWSNEPAPDPRIFNGVVMYVCKARCAKLDKVQRRFRSIELLEAVKQDPTGLSGAQYRVYRVSGPTGPVLDYRLYGADHRDE